MPDKKNLIGRKKIVVNLLDADGCVFNPFLMKKRREAFVLPSPEWSEFFLTVGNETLFNRMRQQIEQSHPDKFIIMSGSNRQSNALDAENGVMNKTGSFFPVLETIAHYFDSYHPQVSLDRFLLADVFCNLLPGTAFVKALREPNEGSHPNCPLEESKILWMYAVSHYLATQYPEDEYELECYFYDDKETILNGLREWLSQNLELMPSNITLTLNHYEGTEQPHAFSPITGQGELDSDYRETTKMLAYSVGVAPEFDWMQCSNNQKIRLRPVDAAVAVTSNLTVFWSGVMAQCAEEIKSPKVGIILDDDEAGGSKLTRNNVFSPRHRRSNTDSSSTSTSSSFLPVDNQQTDDAGFDQANFSKAPLFFLPAVETLSAFSGPEPLPRQLSSTSNESTISGSTTALANASF